MELIKIFKEFKEVLDENQIDLWLEHGTLLGAIRNGKMIPGDDDIDLAAHFEPVKNKIIPISERLYQLGYDVFITDVKLTIKKGEESVSLWLYRKGIIPDHLFRYRVSKKDKRAHLLHYIFLQPLKTMHIDYIHNFTPRTALIHMLKKIVMKIPAKCNLFNLLVSFGKKIDCIYIFDIALKESYIEHFKLIQFHDIEVKVPYLSEEYLTWMYGKDWRIPNKNYDNALDFYRDMEKYNVKRDLLYHAGLISNILEKNKINFWMYGGALLGYVREGRLISWDKDIDLFVWKKDYHKVLELKKTFKSCGFKFSVRDGCIMLKWNDKNITIVHYELKEGYAELEKLCTRNKFGNVIYYGVLCKTLYLGMKRTSDFIRWVLVKTGGCYKVKQVVPSNFFLDLKKIDLFGLKLKVPSDAEGYLEYTFGTDWRIPKKNFKYAKKYIFITEGKKPKSLKYHSNTIR